MRTELSSEILDAVRIESKRAHEKHVDNGGSIFDPNMPTAQKLAALVEEAGEVARAMTYDGDKGTEHLIEELVQLGNVALTWADCLSDQLEASA